jgi:hypothetical protein
LWHSIRAPIEIETSTHPSYVASPNAATAASAKWHDPTAPKNRHQVEKSDTIPDREIREKMIPEKTKLLSPNRLRRFRTALCHSGMALAINAIATETPARRGRPIGYSESRREPVS